jgi:imidazolonepropionase-like amidohydrolase
MGGQFIAIKTHGRTVEEMMVKAPCAMKIAFGENPKSVYNEKHQSPVTRMATAALLREHLYKTIEYMEALEEYEADPDENDKPEFDMKLEATIPVIRGELLVKAHAHRSDDIMTAIRIKNEFDLDMTIEHATEAWTIADILKKEGVEVVIGPLMTDRSKPELRKQNIEAAAILEAAGLPFAIMSDHPEVTSHNLMNSVSMAVRAGLSEDTAFRAVTIQAAKICRIADRVGSIEIGKDADFALYSGHPMDFKTKVDMTVIDGKIVFDRLKTI